MQFLDPFARPFRSRIGKTLSQLHRHLEASRQRDLQALQVFEDWETRSAGHRDTILRQLDCLTRELSDLSSAVAPVPQLSLLIESNDDDTQPAAESTEPGSGPSDADDDGIISSPDAPWHRA